MPNEANFTVAGFIATKPFYSATKTGVPTLTMRLAWTPRRIDRATGEWTDEPTCFVSVKCFGKTAENGRFSLDKGDPVLVTGTLRMHDYEAKDGSRRTNVDITAVSIGHDLSRGVTAFRRLRPPNERAAEDQLADSTPDEAMPADGGLPDSETADMELAEMAEAGGQVEPLEGVEEMMEAAGEPVGAPF